MSRTEKIYPCADCGLMRSEAEGGTIFTLCDICWDKDAEKRNVPNRDKYSVVMTCGACPEQYDVFLEGKMVGYIRMRHGTFTVDSTGDNTTHLFSAYPKGDGCFQNDEERQFYLDLAVKAIDLYRERFPNG